MQSAINLSTCHQLWKIISHKEGVLFLYYYFKLKDPSNHIYSIKYSHIPTYFLFQLLLFIICSLLRMVQGDDHKTLFPAYLKWFFFQCQLLYSVCSIYQFLFSCCWCLSAGRILIKDMNLSSNRRLPHLNTTRTTVCSAGMWVTFVILLWC